MQERFKRRNKKSRKENIRVFFRKPKNHLDGNLVLVTEQEVQLKHRKDDKNSPWYRTESVRSGEKAK